MANTKFEMILEMSFLKISNADVSFDKKTLTWKFCIINQALSTIEQVEIIDLKEFVISTLNIDSETFIIHVAIRKQEEMVKDSIRKA